MGLEWLLRQVLLAAYRLGVAGLRGVWASVLHLDVSHHVGMVDVVGGASWLDQVRLESLLLLLGMLLILVRAMIAEKLDLLRRYLLTVRLYHLNLLLNLLLRLKRWLRHLMDLRLAMNSGVIEILLGSRLGNLLTLGLRLHALRWWL